MGSCQSSYVTIFRTGTIFLGTDLMLLVQSTKKYLCKGKLNENKFMHADYP